MLLFSNNQIIRYESQTGQLYVTKKYRVSMKMEIEKLCNYTCVGLDTRVYIYMAMLEDTYFS